MGRGRRRAQFEELILPKKRCPDISGGELLAAPVGVACNAPPVSHADSFSAESKFKTPPAPEIR